MKALELASLGFSEGALVLLRRELQTLSPGDTLCIRGSHPTLLPELRAWCREQGHRLSNLETGYGLTVGLGQHGRWAHAERAGSADMVHAEAKPEWGFAARGALVEAGTKPIEFPLRRKHELWYAELRQLYAQGAAAQWNPDTIVDWTQPITHSAELEAAVCQVMTFLTENETVALLVPARFLSQVHPHFQEALQVLALQVADEARHIEVFTRRARLHSTVIGSSSASGQASLRTLLEEPDFALASFLLSVLGEGSFLSLLWFLHTHGPDPITRTIVRFAAQDEARHVAYGLGHLEQQLVHEPSLRARLSAAIQRRHEALQHTAGLNADVFDALVLLAAGALTPEAIAQGQARVQALVDDMAQQRSKRLLRLGFSPEEAQALSALHTRNFM